MSPKQIKKNRLSLLLWDTLTHIPGVCKCSQFSRMDQTKSSSSYYKHLFPFHLLLRGLKFNSFLLCIWIISDILWSWTLLGQVSLHTHLCTTKDFLRVDSTAKVAQSKVPSIYHPRCILINFLTEELHINLYSYQ